MVAFWSSVALAFLALCSSPANAFLRAQQHVVTRGSRVPGKLSMSMDAEKVSVAILGASGYTGSELVRILLGHSRVSVRP